MKKSVTRNSAIELYRIVLMFGICLLHSVAECTHANVYLQRLLLPCVVGFVFVSGWFGIRFRVSKVCRLAGTAIFCSIIVRTIDLTLLGGLGYKNCGFDLFTWCKQWWFLNAYLMLMVLAPFLNCMVEGLKSDSEGIRDSAIVACLGILFATFVFGFVSNQYRILIMPRNIGLFFDAPCSFAVFAGIYVAARISRVCDLPRRIGQKYGFLLFLIGIGGVVSGLKWHNSPFSLLLAATSFAGIKGIRIPDMVSRIIQILSPSMFSVYLLHTHKDIGFVLIKRFEDMLISSGLPLICTWIVAAITVFVVAVLLDVPRRLIVRVFRTPLTFALRFCDSCEIWILNSVGGLLFPERDKR